MPERTTLASKYLAVLFCDLERHTDAWHRVPRERMVGIVAEYRYLAESLAGQYGAVYREWAGDGHMFMFESADAAVRFGLKLIESWAIAGRELATLRDVPHLPLRLGCHFAECTQLDGGDAWIGRGNAVAKRVESEADPDTLCVTANVLDLVDLPLYEFSEHATASLEGDYLSSRTLYRIVAFDQSALEARPEEELSAEDWFLRGVSLVGTEREWSDEEAECYREALSLQPDYPEAHVNFAILLKARGDTPEAARHYQEALRLRPDYPEAHYNYGTLLAARGSTGGAAEHFRAALALRPDYVDAHHAYAGLLALRDDVAGATEHYREALRLRPEFAEAHVNFAIVLDRTGDSAAAIEHYREALRLQPGNPATHYNYALLLENSGDVARAEEHYLEAIRLWPEYGEAHNNLAILLQQRSETDAAERHYLAALRARPDDPEAHYNYGLLLRARGDTEDSERHFRTAFELSPEVPEFRSALEGPS